MTNMFTTNDELDLTAVAERYKNDPNEMIKALAHKEAHIQRLEAEAKERSNGKTLEEVLEELKKSQVPPQSQVPTSTPAQSVLDDTTLEQKLNTMLQKKAETDRINTNKAEVQATLLKEFKEVSKATEAMALKAKELGMTSEALDAIALNSPSAFYKLVGIESNQRPFNAAPTMGNIRTNMSETKPVDVHEKYRDMLKNNRTDYMSEATQRAIMADAMKAAGL